MKSFWLLFTLLLIPSACVATVQPVEATASAIVQNDSMWIDSIGMLHIFGEVRNTGDVWLQYVKITGTLKDASNEIVDVVFAFTSTMFLAPSSAGPFDMIELDPAKSTLVRSYSLVVEFHLVSAVDRELAIINIADSKSSLGWLEVVGEVLNQGDATSEYTKVTGTFYDADGKVVYVAFAFTSPSDVPAGYRYDFKLTVPSDERTSKIRHFSLIAESQTSGYISIPYGATTTTTQQQTTATTSITCSIADHVVINEVELNPPGNDAGNEWVELYNPTNTAVDLTGWFVRNGPAENRVAVPVPPIIMDPNGHYTVTHPSQWLDNQNETLTLLNKDGQEIDKTPWLSDTASGDQEDYSWQRYPDGCDNWSFAAPTQTSINVFELFSPVLAVVMAFLVSLFAFRRRVGARGKV